MSVRHRNRADEGRHRIPPVAELLDPSAGRAVATHLVGDKRRPIGFDDVRAQAAPEWSVASAARLRQRAQRQAEDAIRRAFDPHGLPRGFEVCPVDLVAVAASRATVEENLAAIRREADRLGKHTVGMVLNAVGIAELLGAEETGAEVAV